MTPFFPVDEVCARISSYVEEINKDITSLPTRGPASKYELLDEGKRGSVTLTWLGEPHKGIACNLNSPGYKALIEATRKYLPEAKPYSLTGSLPLVGDLQKAGFDVQITGFGRMDAYHAANEYALYSEFARALKITATIIEMLNK